MALKKSHGNMYDWVTHMHSHLAGECLHKCNYCYVQRNPFGVSARYKGQPCLIKYELNTDYGKGNTIFIEHMNDMFAEGIFKEWIRSILSHCSSFPSNTYIFQTKNPKRAFKFLDYFPPVFIIGTTIESNRPYEDSAAPAPIERYEGIRKFKQFKTFVTLEPIMDFDVDILFGWLCDIRPDFINIGADSKKCSLPEPLPYKVKDLINKLRQVNINIKKKVNLERLLK